MKLNFKEMFDSVSKFTNEHSPEIATGVGIACMFGATATAVVVTVKTMNMLAAKKEEKLAEICPSGNFEDLDAEEQQEYDHVLLAKPTLKDAAKVGWKWWLLPSSLLAAGTGCILYSDREQAKRISSLMAKVGVLAFKAAEAKDYKEAAKEILGEEKEKEIDDAAVKKNAKRRSTYDYKNDNLPRFGTAVQRYMEYYSGKEFWADPIYINEAVNELNARILEVRDDGIEEYVQLNEWNDILQIDRAGCGNVLAFDVAQGTVKLYMTNANVGVDHDGLATIVLRFNKPPQYYTGV